MDANELRDTTLDKEKRNIYKIEIPDVKKAEESMNNFMNGNSKYVDFRKNILLTKQPN
jgi:DNA gyrase/topoisomerase IV subunit B